MSGFVTKPHNSLVSQKTFLHKFSGVGGWMLIDPLSQFNGGFKSIFISSRWSRWMDVD